MRTYLPFLFLSFFFLELLQSQAQNTTRPNVPVPNGFEVNSYTGNLYQSRTDLKIPGQGLNIDITFSYNVSRRSRDWGMGKGWTFTYNMAYSTDTAGVWVERPDGRRDLYRKSGATYVAPTGVYDALIEYQTGKFYVKTKEDLRYYFDNAIHKKLTKMQDANGNLINLAYTDTLLTTLTDGAGHTFAFTWTTGRLTEITDNSCSPSRKVSYEYDTKGNLIKVTNPIGDNVRYYYDPTAKIIGYTDEGGNNMSIVYNSNSAVLKVASCATTHVFSYVSQQSKTYVTEQVESQKVITTYTFDAQGRIASKKGNCCGFNVDYTYDNQNNVKARRDGNNKQTSYEYDSSGNVTKETDAAGNFTTYAYEATHNKVASMTDKNGNTTTYQYNAAGNLIQVNKPLSVTEKHTYDAKGNRLTDTDGNNNVTSYEYNSNGYLTKVTDAEGGITAYTYDCHGNRLTEIDARNNTTRFEYNALDQLIKTTDALNNVTTYTYDKLGNLLTITNPLGKTTSYAYDGLGRRISTTLPMGNTTHTAYDEQGNVIKETDANGNTTTSTYNSRKQPLTVTDALGHTMSYEYDEAGNKTAETDKNGNTTRFAYDDQYRLIKRIDALGGITAYSYDAMGNRVAEVDANGNATTYQYDALQRVIKITDALNKSLEFTYDKNGNRVTEKDKNGNVTTFSYDKLNRIKTITDALNGVSTYIYDATGNILTEKNSLNHTTTYTYDALNRRLTVTNPIGEVTTNTYDAIGSEKTIALPNGNVITNTYDDNSRLLTSADDLGILTSYTYDNNGNMITEKDGNNNTKTYVYDALNRQSQIIDALNKATTMAFDKNGNLISQTDRNGNTKSYTYDALNRKISETDALNYTTRFAYDAVGNRLTITDAKNNITSYNYDALNRLIKETYADGTFHQFTYDPTNNRKTRRDARGILTTYTYDALNRLTKRSYPNNAEETFSYDAASRRLTANNANATITFTYDNANRLLTETLNSKTTTYTYNTASHTRTITYPGGRVINQEKNKRDQLIAIKEGSTTHAAFSYDSGDRLTQKSFANGYSSAYSYNENNWLTSLVCTPNNVVNFTYTYDNEGNRLTSLKNHRPTHSEKYTYDKIHQLTGFFTGKLSGEIVSDTTLKNHYVYDALHNRITSFEDGTNRIYTANNLNAYTSIIVNGQVVNYNYDNNGNTTNDESKTYSYDYENRLTKVNNGSTAEHFYDALGRRIKTITPTETINFYFSNNQIIEERNASDAIEKTYIYGAWMDDAITYTYAGSTYYLINNPQGSVLAALNQTGVEERYEYNSYGRETVYDNSFVLKPYSTINNSILFNGRISYKGTELHDFRARAYQHTNGRFIHKDPLKYIDTYNLYQFAFNSPINYSDNLGMSSVFGVHSNRRCGKYPLWVCDKVDAIVSHLPYVSHRYDLQTKICSKAGDEECHNNKKCKCTAESVFNMMASQRRFAAPAIPIFGELSLSDGDETQLIGPNLMQFWSVLEPELALFLTSIDLMHDKFTNPIFTSVDRSRHIAINYTQFPHIFYPGTITRQVFEDNDGVYMYTLGAGYATFPALIPIANVVGGIGIFKTIDYKLKYHFEHCEK